MVMKKNEAMKKLHNIVINEWDYKTQHSINKLIHYIENFENR